MTNLTDGTGHAFVGWEFEGQVYPPGTVIRLSSSGPLTFKAVWDTYVIGRNSYTVYLAGDFKASVSTSKAAEGDPVFLIPEPDPGYAVETIKVLSNGKHLAIQEGTNGIYSFIMPQHDVSIEIAFAKAYAVTASAQNGGLDLSKESALAGRKVFVTPQNTEGYTLTSLKASYSNGEKLLPLTANCAADQPDGSYFFIMPDSNVQLEAVFSLVKAETFLTQTGAAGKITQSEANYLNELLAEYSEINDLVAISEFKSALGLRRLRRLNFSALSEVFAGIAAAIIQLNHHRFSPPPPFCCCGTQWGSCQIPNRTPC